MSAVPADGHISVNKKNLSKSKGQVSFWKIKVSGCFASISALRCDPENMICPILMNFRAISLDKYLQRNWKWVHPFASSSHIARSLNHYRKWKLQAKPFVSIFATSAASITRQCRSAARANNPSCPGAVTHSSHHPSAQESSISCSRCSESSHNLCCAFCMGTWRKHYFGGWFMAPK